MQPAVRRSGVLDAALRYHAGVGRYRASSACLAWLLMPLERFSRVHLPHEKNNFACLLAMTAAIHH